MELFAENLPDSIIKKLSLRVKKINGINLGQGIPSFPTAPHIIQAAKKALDDKTIGVYPNFLGVEELRLAISHKLNLDQQVKITADNVLVTVGAMEAVSASILALLNTGDQVGIVTPDYCNHFPVVMLAKGKIIEIPMHEGKVWQLDIKKVEAAAKQGLKVLLITNPGNPTGAVYDHDQIGCLVKLANQYGFWIISDETYSYLDYANKFCSLLEFWDESKKLIVVRTFSKEYCMTGWRVGYLVTRPETVKLIARSHDAIVGCASKISQRAALAAITGSEDTVSKNVKVLFRRRELVCKHLDNLSNDLTYAKPEGAYYIFPRLKNFPDSFKFSDEVLDKAGVAVVPGAAFGKAGESHIRISFAVEDEVLDTGMKRIKKFFQNRDE